MWDAVLEPGRLVLLDGPHSTVTGFLQELAHEARHRAPGPVLWCDGSHAFNPAVFAELNLTCGLAADDGAERLLVKRCMTPFQWDSTLHQHLPDKLATEPAALVVAHPFEALWTHEEIQDWEQEDYVRFSLDFLRNLAAQRGVAIVLGCDLQRLWRTHAPLATLVAGVASSWHVTAPAGRWRLEGRDGTVLDPSLRRQGTLLDFMAPEDRVVVRVPPRGRRDKDAKQAARPWRTRILHDERGLR